jgi:hypothetical protein
MTHWAYIEWEPTGFRDYEVSVVADHARKDCASKSEPTDVVVECDVILSLPDLLRHCVSAETKESVMSAARCWAYEFAPWGSNYNIIYIGEMT